MGTKKKSGKAQGFVILAVIMVAAAIALYLSGFGQNTKDKEPLSEYSVEKGSITTTVTGSGRLRPQDSLTIKLPGGIKLTEVLVEEGDTVLAGEVLASLDPATLSYRAALLSDELAALDRQIASGTTQASILAPVAGRIKSLPAEEDSQVLDVMADNGALAIISTDSLMSINIATEAELDLFSEVTVKWGDNAVDGVVADKTAIGYRITLDDAKAPYQAKASVYDGKTLLGEGILEINEPVSVLGTGGTIETVLYKTDDPVNARTKLFALKHEPNTGSYTRALKDRSDKADELREVLALIKRPELTAPKGGLISFVYMDDGEMTGSAAGAQSSSSASETSMGTRSAAGASAGAATSHEGNVVKYPVFELSVGGAVKMQVDVDELDINKVQLNQEVTVAMDAFAGESFPASVTRISKLGKASGSITNYTVEVSLSPDERLLEGMNGSAVIMTDKADDVLLIPILAINESAEGSFVLVKDSDNTQKQVMITTGISDGTNAEVTSGLSQGDVVLYRSSYQDPLALLMNESREYYQNGTMPLREGK